jgi:hypothetical protein
MKTTNWWVFLIRLFIGFGTSVNAQFSCGTPELSCFEKTELSIALQNNNQKKLRRLSYSIAINAVIVQPNNSQPLLQLHLISTVVSVLQSAKRWEYQYLSYF